MKTPEDINRDNNDNGGKSIAYKIMMATVQKGKGIFIVNKEDSRKSFSIVSHIIESGSFSEKEKVELIRIAVKTLGSNAILKEYIGLHELPLKYAIKQNMFYVAQGIIELLDNIDLQDINTLIMQQQDCSFDCIPLLKLMLSKVDTKGNNNIKAVNVKVTYSGQTPIFTAVAIRSMKIIYFLIEMGADLDVVDSYGDTLLIQACLYPFDHTFRELKEYLQFVGFLCSKIDVNHRNKGGVTALHCAAKGHPLLLQCLIKHGADVNAVSYDGKSPLDEGPSILLGKGGFNEPIRYSGIQLLLKKAGAVPNPFQETFVTKTCKFVEDNKDFSKNSLLFKQRAGKRAARNKRGKSLLYETKVRKEQEYEAKVRDEQAQAQVERQHYQYKKVLWSLMQRESRRILLKMLESIKSVEQQTILYQKFDGVTLPFHDFTNQTSYRFIVHTTQTDEDKCKEFEELLKQIGNNDPELFIKRTPYFSCSLVDKNTDLSRMSHQKHDIFPIALIIDAAEDAVFRAYSFDIGSPFGNIKDEERTEYLKILETANIESDAFETQLRSESLDSFAIEDLMSGAELFSTTSRSYSDQPFLTPDRVLRITPDYYYNELIVTGKPNNRVMGIAVEKQWLDTFKLVFSDLSSSAEKKGPLKLLEILANFLKENPSIPLILLNTNEYGYLYKKPVDLQMEGLIENYCEIAKYLQELLLKAHRFEHALTTFSPSQKSTPLYQKYMQKLTVTREEIRVKTAIVEELELAIKQNRALVEQETELSLETDILQETDHLRETDLQETAFLQETDLLQDTEISEKASKSRIRV